MQEALAVTPLTRTTLRDQAYDLIRCLILTGRLAPGSRISERSLAEQLGVSRAPVKDALLQLGREGFVVSRSDGRYVQAFGVRELEQLARVRGPLEGLAAQLAAECTTPAKAAALSEALEAFERACQAHDPDAFVTSDVAIHCAIWEQTENPYLLSALRCIAVPTFLRVADCMRFVDERWRAPVEEHAAIVTFINRGEAQRAAEAMAEHVQNAHARSLRVLGEDPAAHS